MYSSCFEVTFLIFGAASLKEKRMVVKSIRQRCKAKFNVSVIECSGHEKWQICGMGFALAAINSSTAEQITQKIIEFLYNDDRIEITKIEKY